ncbi:hypothetical protein [Faucicola atlantae]|nr:hypothetical protein [Moraxella atlantae]
MAATLDDAMLVDLISTLPPTAKLSLCGKSCHRVWFCNKSNKRSMSMMR